jgi:hypothetical protein
MTDGFDFSHIDKKGVYGYWDHMDYIIRTAESKGIYIGMVCIWGGLVRSGQMDVEEAKAYGTFLAERYKDNPNIVWIIGGDTRGDVKTEVWETLARTIRSIDKNHLMTFHPGAAERSIGKKETLELAVMVDTFKPLMVTEDAMGIADETYYQSWLEE